jgi:hypothetical protein
MSLVRLFMMTDWVKSTKTASCRRMSGSRYAKEMLPLRRRYWI